MILLRESGSPLSFGSSIEAVYRFHPLENPFRESAKKMLVQHLNELCEYGLIDKTKSDGYPLKSDYFLTERGKQIFEAISIMQSVGIDIMKEDQREDFLKSKGLL